MEDAIAIRPIYIEQNQGLGNALRVALDNCKYELVARMDSDDVSSHIDSKNNLISSERIHMLIW